MRLTTAFCALTLSSSAVSVELLAQDAAPRPPEIAVTGRGDISVVPDRAVLLATIVTNANSATVAGSENARIVAQAIERLRAAGATEKQITNGGYSLGQDYESGDRRRPRGFVARNTMRIEVPQVANIGRMLDAALAGGASEIAPIQFIGPDMASARSQALRAAMLDARRDAEALADAAGGSLGKLLSVTTGPSQPRFGSFEATGAVLASAAPTVIRPNDVTVSAFASVRWEFVPKR
jgi:uncharacterized protein YggE